MPMNHTDLTPFCRFDIRHALTIRAYLDAHQHMRRRVTLREDEYGNIYATAPGPILPLIRAFIEGVVYAEKRDAR